VPFIDYLYTINDGKRYSYEFLSERRFKYKSGSEILRETKGGGKITSHGAENCRSREYGHGIANICTYSLFTIQRREGEISMLLLIENSTT
jgi:hypothetical protein